MQDKAFIAFQAAQVVTKRQTMDQPEEKGEEIDQGKAGWMLHLPAVLQQVVNGCGDNGQRDEEFDPAGGEMQRSCGAEGQGYRMSDGKGRHQDHHFSPILYQIAQTKGPYEEDMVHCVQGEDMVGAYPEIYFEFIHAGDQIYSDF